MVDVTCEVERGVGQRLAHLKPNLIPKTHEANPAFWFEGLEVVFNSHSQVLSASGSSIEQSGESIITSAGAMVNPEYQTQVFFVRERERYFRREIVK